MGRGRAGAAEAPLPRQVGMLWACASRRCVLTKVPSRRYTYCWLKQRGGSAALFCTFSLFSMFSSLVSIYGFEPPRAWPCSLKVMEKACGGSSSFLPAVRARGSGTVQVG